MKCPKCYLFFPGILVTGGIESVSLEQYDLQMNINSRSVYHMMQVALPHLLKTKGNIVNISSVTGLRAVSTRHVTTIGTLNISQ